MNARLIGLLGAALLVGCGGAAPTSPAADRAMARFRKIDPAAVLEPVGDFAPGRVTFIYVPVELVDGAGKALHPPMTRAERRAAIERDRAFIFSERRSPLRGHGDQVNLLLEKAPLRVKMSRRQVAALAKQPKASEVVDVWDHHAWLEGLVAAHADFFGGEPQAIYQIPFAVRDQATWFRFDRPVTFAEAAVGAWKSKDWVRFTAAASEAMAGVRDPAEAFGRISEAMLSISGPERLIDTAFPKLRVPLVWHAVSSPKSSVVLFHELGHIGECRASDEYAEQSAAEYFEANPREAAVVRFLGRTVTAGQVVEALERRARSNPLVPGRLIGRLRGLAAKVPASHKGYNASTWLLNNSVSRRAVGKVMGEPNVLPDDPRIIERVWYSLPRFKARLRAPRDPAKPKAGDVRVVPGGLYLEGYAFVRLQIFSDGAWRNGYMGDSQNERAPIGPVMEACLGRFARRISQRAGR